MNKNLVSGPGDFQAKVPQLSVPSDCVGAGDWKTARAIPVLNGLRGKARKL